MGEGAASMIIEESQQETKHHKRTKPRRVSGLAVKKTTKRNSVRGLGMGAAILVERNDSMDRTFRAAMISRGSSTRGLGLDVEDDVPQKLTRRKPPSRTGSFAESLRGIGRNGSFKALRESMRNNFRRRPKNNTEGELPALERSDSMCRMNRSMLNKRSSSRRMMVEGEASSETIKCSAEISTDEDYETGEEDMIDASEVEEDLSDDDGVEPEKDEVEPEKDKA